VPGFIAVEQSASLRFEFTLIVLQLTTVDKLWLECLGFIYNQVIVSLLFCTDSFIEFVECAVRKSQTILLHNINFIAKFYKICHVILRI
jgi:hypothetical protein